ncbi:unnamed protein product [marine sediment metagenome]|uniref:Uncharacterized protein n=1 Tax=marine sediment metagenome TaxID=412755 RepID=X1RZ89_9ZZZZ
MGLDPTAIGFPEFKVPFILNRTESSPAETSRPGEGYWSVTIMSVGIDGYGEITTSIGLAAERG